MSTDHQQILTLLNLYKQATNTGDAELAASLYMDDAILIPANFPKAVGKEAIHKFYHYAFSLLRLNLEFEIDLDQIIIREDFAYATTTSDGTRLILQTEEIVPEDNRELWLFERHQGEWKIARYMFNIPPKHQD